jgi:hypothetical protein
MKSPLFVLLRGGLVGSSGHAIGQGAAGEPLTQRRAPASATSLPGSEWKFDFQDETAGVLPKPFVPLHRGNRQNALTLSSNSSMRSRASWLGRRPRWQFVLVPVAPIVDQHLIVALRAKHEIANDRR